MEDYADRIASYAQVILACQDLTKRFCDNSKPKKLKPFGAKRLRLPQAVLFCFVSWASPVNDVPAGHGGSANSSSTALAFVSEF